MVTCPKCGSPINGTQMYCVNCNAKIPAEVLNRARTERQGSKKTKYLCGKCRNELVEGETVCRKCGTKNKLPSSAVAQAEKVSFCHNCGTKVAEGHQFCPSCGTRIINNTMNTPQMPQYNNVNYNSANVNYNPNISNSHIQWQGNKNLSLFQYFAKCMKHYADFNGRARRSEYWGFYLFTIIFMVCAMILDTIIGTIAVITCLWSLVIIIPSLAVAVRRLHDIGKSGGWIFIQLVPFIGSIWLLALLCTDSDAGANQYGVSDKYK